MVAKYRPRRFVKTLAQRPPITKHIQDGVCRICDNIIFAIDYTDLGCDLHGDVICKPCLQQWATLNYARMVIPCPMEKCNLPLNLKGVLSPADQLKRDRLVENYKKEQQSQEILPGVLYCPACHTAFRKAGGCSEMTCSVCFTIFEAPRYMEDFF